VSVETVTLPALLRRRAEADGDLPALVSEADAITYAALDRESLRVAGWLVGQGVVKGSRVGLMAPNGVDWAVVALAAMRIGATLVPLSTFLKPPELTQQLAIAAVTQLILVEGFRGRDYLAELGEAAQGFDPATRKLARSDDLPSLRAVWVLGDVRSAADPAMAAMAEALEGRVRPADDLAVIFTSGSRGAPKGVIHTHGNAFRAVGLSLEARRLQAGDRLYIPMPFFWTGGFATGLLSAILAGATLLTEAEPEPARTLRFLQANKVTLFRGWPEQAQALAGRPEFAAADLSSLKPGSLDAVMPPALRAPVGARAPLLGMTETFGPYCGWRLDQELPRRAWGSCGKPFEGVELRVVDPGTGAPCAPGQVGMIQVRGPSLMRGICGRTREEVFTADRFYPTGDLGRLDADGFLFFEGRADDLFKVRGVTVSPGEVEAALRAVAGVRRAYVLESAGEVGAVVLLEPGASLTTSDLAAAARGALSAFKVPNRWALLREEAQVPLTATAKVDKAGLQALLDNPQGAGASASTNSSTIGYRAGT
jgi:acyl-CoA synthetase (AMP-forming)/AMP-acid ligase II